MFQNTANCYAVARSKQLCNSPSRGQRTKCLFPCAAQPRGMISDLVKLAEAVVRSMKFLQWLALLRFQSYLRSGLFSFFVQARRSTARWPRRYRLAVRSGAPVLVWIPTSLPRFNYGAIG